MMQQGINTLEIDIAESGIDDKNTITINIIFSIEQIPNVLDSIQIEVK